MDILKRENWWIWLMLFIFTGGTSTIVLAALLNLFDKKAWYANWKNWLIAFLCLIFPIIIMFYIFIIEMLCKVAAKLKVPGHEIYLSPAIWIVLLIIPIIGWALFMIELIYLVVWIIIMLYRGNGERFIGERNDSK